MTNIVINAENISKKYIINHDYTKGYNTFRDNITEYVKNIFKGNNKIKQEEFWALKNINFQIKQGERVAFMGHNGAGKSTLLKILSRIVEPSTGKISMQGKVTSLLEVGTGFHPELTGRENVFLNGAILGMTKMDIRKHFDEIVAFSEIENFIDTPVKRYSSGMYVKLAFSVAAYLTSEILILDEVLAVGDINFQKKCVERIKNLVADSGKTVIFVSHNINQIQDLCTRGILIEKGNIIVDDKIEIAIENYKNG